MTQKYGLITKSWTIGTATTITPIAMPTSAI